MQMLETLHIYISRYVVLSDDEFSAMSKFLEVRSFGKKQQLIKIGETENYLNFVVKGLARKFFYKKKEEIITQFAKETNLVNSSVSFLSNTPSNYVVETIEPTTFLSISKQNLEDLYLAFPRMERLGRLIVTQLFLEKEFWEYDRMRHDSHERFIHFMEENADLLQRVPQKYLASYLNIKPETFSRLKHLLRKKK